MVPSGEINGQGPPDAGANTNTDADAQLVCSGFPSVTRTDVPISAAEREQTDTVEQSQDAAPWAVGDDGCNADDGGDESISGSDDEESIDVHERTEVESQNDLDRLFEVESQAASAQEEREMESVSLHRAAISKELSGEYDGNELVDKIEAKLAEHQALLEDSLSKLEEESTQLQERLDGDGVSLPVVFKQIEQQTAENCRTAAWKNRTHWVGLQATAEVMDVVRQADADLDCFRPVMKRQGEVVEQGASGMLSRKPAAQSDSQRGEDSGWEALESPAKGPPDGVDAWKEIYKASTPMQVVHLGGKLQDALKVDELGDVEPLVSEPLLLEALENEEKHGLTADQAKSLRKITEEDDSRRMRLKPQHLDIPLRGLEGADQLYKPKHYENKVARLPAAEDDSSCRKRRRITPEQVMLFRQAPTGGDIDKPAPAIIVLDDDESDASPAMARTEERALVNNTVPVAQSLQIVEDRIAEKVKEKNVLCTACGGHITRQEVVKHPMLLVAICRPCKIKCKHHTYTKDERGRETQCRWCASCETVRSCEKCAVGICAECWSRNFGLSDRSKVCIVCNKSLLKPLQRHAEEVVQDRNRLGYLCAARTRQARTKQHK